MAAVQQQQELPVAVALDTVDLESQAAAPAPSGLAVGPPPPAYDAVDGIPVGFPVFDANADNGTPSLTPAPTPHIDTQSHYSEQGCRVVFDAGAWVVLLLCLAGVLPVWGLGIWGALVAWSVCQSWSTDTYRYLSNKLEAQGLQPYLDKIKGTTPVLMLWGRAYHTETRERTVTDSDGNSKTESYTVDVETHSARTEIKVERWDDASPLLPLDELEDVDLLQLTCGVVWRADDATNRDLAVYKAGFDAYHNRDVNYSSGYSFGVSGLTRKMLCVQSGALPWWLSLGYYRLATLLCAGSLYIMYFDNSAARLAYCFEKQLTTSAAALGDPRST